MPFQPVNAEKLSSAVVKQIEQLILRGILRPGDRLPAERELAERLGVSRPSLREAISQLQDQGLLIAKAGSGVFVADVLGSAFSPAMAQLIASHDEAVFDYITFRRDLEGLAASRAAQFGSDTDLALINTLFEKMEAAHQKRNPATEASLDADFHMAIIEASHNIILIHMMRSMMDLLRQGVFYNRQTLFKQRRTRETLLEQHRAINTAIQSRDRAAAEAAVHAHMRYVKEVMHEHREAIGNEAISRLRLDQENARR